jgi:heat shock protein HslJ
MKKSTLLPCAIAASALLTIGAGCATQDPAVRNSDTRNTEVAGASSVPLVATLWRLTQLGSEVVQNPAGANAVSLQLLAQNSRAAGFAGCNRMFGGYALSNDTLRFEQMGATKMACMENARMQLEQRYLDMFANVARWKITGNTLELLDAAGQSLATFEGSAS